MTQTEHQQLKDYEFLRPAEAALYMRIGRTTLWRWAKERKAFPKPIKMGPTVTVFRRSELDAYLKSLEGERLAAC